MSELVWVTKQAPGGIEISIDVEKGVATLRVTATSDDGQIINMSAKADHDQLMGLSWMARDAAAACG